MCPSPRPSGGRAAAPACPRVAALLHLALLDPHPLPRTSEGQCVRRLPRPGEGAGSSRGNVGVLPRGGTQELQRGHGRASEEGT